MAEYSQVFEGCWAPVQRMYIFESPRIKAQGNRLSEKRRLDKIKEEVDSAKFKPNFVATAITRLSTAGLISSPQETPETPTESKREMGIDLTLSGTKNRRISEENLGEGKFILTANSRLSSIKLV